MKIRMTILAVVLALCLLLPLAAWADPCPQSSDGTHAWSDWTVDWDCSCGYNGQKSRTCANCGATETEPIPATGEHTWGEWYYFEDADQPTCTSPGKQTRWCMVCQKQDERTVPATGHQFGEWSLSLEPTCTQEGTRVRYCKYQDANESETIPAKGHTPVTIPAVAATCTAGGKTEGSKCSVCGEILTAQTDIPAKGHTPVTIPAVAATCIAAGKTEGSKCSVCGTILTAPADVPAKGHKWGAWQQYQPGKEDRTCSRCGKKEYRLAPLPEEAGLLLTCEKVTRLDPADGYTDVYEADLKLKNTGAVPLHFAVDASYGIGDDMEVITDELVGFTWEEGVGIVQPGETFSFQYKMNASGSYYDGEKRTISRLIYAGGWSDTGLRTNTFLPVIINLPAEDGLLLTVDNMHRSGTGTDEIITFDLTVTNQVTGWSVISASAENDMGPLNEGEGFENWPKDGLLLGYGQSYSFSYFLRPTPEEVEKGANNMPYAWTGRYITVQDLQGHTATARITAKMQTPQTAETLLDGAAEVPDHLCSDESASVPVSLTLRNIGTLPVAGPAVKGVLMTNSGRTLRTFTLASEEDVTVLQPQESATFTLDVPVGPEDESAALEEDENLLRFAFYAEYSYEDPEQGPAHGESNIWQQSIPVWELPAGDPRSSYVIPVLTVSFEDKVYKPGEKVMLNLKVENVNPEDTIEGIRFEWYLVDEQGETGEPIVYDRPDIVLKPGESFELDNHFFYGVDQEEALKGVVVLDFHAWCHSATYDWNANSDWSGLIHMEAD